MTDAQHIEILVSVVPSLAFFMVYWLGLRPKTRLFSFRDDMFALRDGMFDAMAETKSSFQDPGYMAFRNIVNGTIAISTTINPLMVGWLVITGRIGNRRSPSAAELAETDTVRLILVHAERQYVARVVKFVFFQHVTGFLVSWILLARSFLKRRILWWRALDDNRAIRAFLELAGIAGRTSPRRLRPAG